MHLLTTTGQYFVWIGLVTDVPHDRIAWRIEAIVQSDREFDGAETGGEVSAARGDLVDQKFAQLGC